MSDDIAKRAALMIRNRVSDSWSRHGCQLNLEGYEEEVKAAIDEATAKAAEMARAAEPKNGWGTRSTISDVWADGFRTACVEISDALTAEKPVKG